MLEFDDSWKLVTVLSFLCELETFSYLLNFQPQNLLLLFIFEKLLVSQNLQKFLIGISSSCLNFNIPDACLVENFNSRDSSFLILESWMSPHVMYGSAGFE